MVRDFKNIKTTTKKDARPRKKQMVSRTYKLSWPTLDKKVYILIAVIVVVLFGYLSQFREQPPAVCITRYGRLADQFVGKGLLVRNEEVVYAPFAGKVDLSVKGGTRYPSGKRVLSIAGEAGEKNFFIPEAGIVSFAVDGLETTLKPGILANLQQDYTEFKGKSTPVKDGETVNAGRPLFKLIDNYDLYMLVQAPAEEALRYGRGDKAWLTFENTTIVGWISEIIKRQNLFVIQLERFPDEMAGKRWVEVNVMADAYHGVIVPRKSIAEKDGKAGVYRMAEGRIFFQPVTIRGGTLDEAVVTGIARGVEILVNPEEYMAKYEQGQTNIQTTSGKEQESSSPSAEKSDKTTEKGNN